MLCKEKGVKGIYSGESGHSAYYRGNFHLDGLRKQSANSVLHNHNLDHHPNHKMTSDDFAMVVEGNYARAILRQSQEGVAIATSIREKEVGESVVVMNSKREFMQPGVVRPMFRALGDRE